MGSEKEKERAEEEVGVWLFPVPPRWSTWLWERRKTSGESSNLAEASNKNSRSDISRTDPSQLSTTRALVSSNNRSNCIGSRFETSSFSLISPTSHPYVLPPKQDWDTDTSAETSHHVLICSFTNRLPPDTSQPQTHHVGVIMNGVTGRMGTNQHLIRSIMAIRFQGGLRCSEGGHHRAEPDPCRSKHREAE